MEIKGLQKLTLLDYPEKIACVVFTGGCNFRCPYCHNASLVFNKIGEAIEEEEIFAFLEKRKGILDGVVITGGEPLLQRDIENFIKKIKEKGFLVKLDTNGSFPEKLKGLADKKLIDYIAMDIKNSKAKYAKTAGNEKLDITAIEKSIKIVMESGIDYEFRTTVTKELFQEEDFDEIGKWIAGAKKYYLQNFVNSGDLVGENGMTPLSKNEIIRAKSILNRYIGNVFIRGE